MTTQSDVGGGAAGTSSVTKPARPVEVVLEARSRVCVVRPGPSEQEDST
jgi:hypothetical protein